MQLLDGKYVSEKVKISIAEDAAAFLADSGRKPHLVAILVGNDGGSETYVASNIRMACLGNQTDENVCRPTKYPCGCDLRKGWGA